MLTEDIRTIATNISDTTVTQDWSWKNAAFALLDPDTGVVPNIKARLIRDNNDFFLLQNAELDNGYRIEYGGNMIGVNWDVDVEEVVTRIIPKCKDASGNDLFLPEQWIDADNADDYAALRMSVMDCDYQEGKEYKDEEGQTETLTKERCYELMRADVAKAYDVDKVNQATFSLSVEFVNLGDTEEYKQYKGLQRLNLYDTVHIKHGKLGLESDMQMKAYVWDCILQRYISAEFGDAFESVGGDIPGYELAGDSIRADKIAEDTRRDLNTTYTLTKSGNQIRLTGSDGSDNQVTDSDTTYSNATQSAAGLMSASDKAKLDALEVGGRNLLLYSAEPIVYSAYSTINVTRNISVPEWGATDATRVAGGGGSNMYVCRVGGNTVDMAYGKNVGVNGKNYTISVWIKNNHATNRCGVRTNLPYDPGYTMLDPGESMRVEQTAVGNGSTMLCIYFRTGNKGEDFDFTIWHPKIEEGTFATDWTPAVEDYAGEASVTFSSIRNTTNTTSNAGGTVRKVGKTVNLIFSATLANALAASTWLTIGTLPSGYLPTENIYTSAVWIGGTVAQVYIGTGSAIQVWSSQAQGAGAVVRGSVTWFTA
jgi:phage minor structural protein